MKKIAYITSEGLITQCYESLIDLEEPPVSIGDLTAVFFDSDLDYYTLCMKCYFKDNEIKQLPDKPSEFYTWNLEVESWIYSEDLHNQYLAKLKTEALRKRNGLLINSDWTELPSALLRLGEVKVTEWQTYRQALRDITKQSGYPENVVWPEQPTN